jgi:hypothetical protein
VIHPQGHLHLKEFRQDQFPVFVYDVDGLELEQLVFMVHGENTTVIQYEGDGGMPAGCTLEFRPLIAFRDYHSTTHENGFVNASLGIQQGWQKEPNCSSSRWAELPAECREVLVLREPEQLSYQEIADVAGIPLGTVISRLSRARQQLQQTLDLMQR